MTDSTRVALQNCGKTFADGTHALDPIDLTVNGGETLVLLGPSGCGKTTTLRMIAGLEFPDPGGKVFFDQDEVTPLPIEKRSVGMVFQSYALFPNMTVAENVAYGLRIRRTDRAARQKQVSRMLEMMHIAEFADRQISQLSGGQRQRVALARALAVEPRVLLLDEPLTALDAKLRVSLREEINATLRRLGITAVYVTHDQDEAMALGDRIVAMNKGHIAQIGTPREIYQAPASPFVADFIGTTNRLSGRMQGGTFAHPALRRALALETPVADGAAEIFFRPNALTLTTAKQADLCGTVTAAFFLGDRVRLHVQTRDDLPPVLIDAPPESLPDQGEVIPLRIDPRQVLVFPTPEAAS